MVLVDSGTWNLRRLYHMIFSAVMHFNDGAFLMLHIECDRLSIIKACEIALYPPQLRYVVMKSGGNRKNKVDCTVDLGTTALMGFSNVLS